MYQGSAAFTTANDKSIQKHRVRGSIDNIPFTGSNILAGSMTITNQCSDNTDMKIGAVFVGKLTMTFLKNLSVTPTSWQGRKITIIFGLCIDEENNIFEEFEVGQYYVSEASITADGVTVTAYDAMSKFDRKLPTDYIVSGKVADITRAICSTCGVTFGMTDPEVMALPNGNLPLGSYTPNDCQTYRDLIYWLSQTIGGFATINRAGKLIYRTYYERTDPAETIGPSKRVQGAAFSDFETDFGSAVFDNADGTAERIGSVGVGATYYIGFNPFLQYGTNEARTLLRTNVFNSVSDMVFTPFKVELMSSPIYELGDVLAFSGGILDGQPKKGIVQSVSWQLNRGMILSGFGANPALQDVQTASEKANSSARRSEQNSEVVYRDYTNLIPIAVNADPVKVTDIYFTTNKQTDVEVWHEIQIQTTKSGTDPMIVQAVYTLDNVEIDRKPIETFGEDGFHILDLHYFMPIEEIGSHRWEVFLTATGGTAAIRSNDAIAVLKGQGISKADGWTGVIILEDDFDQPHYEYIAPEFTGEATVNLHENDNISVSDLFVLPEMTMSVEGFGAVPNVTLYTPTKQIVTENKEFNIVTEDEIYNIVGEIE